MAHELTTRTDGSVEMAFRQGTTFPWHFKQTRPQQVPVDASIADWISAAGMGWTVESAAVEFAAADGEFHCFASRRVLHRSDTLAPLGIVSDDYCILHPREVIGFFDDLVQSVGLQLDTAGTLFGGKRFWALASIGEDCIIDDRDAVKGYLLLSSSADGARATEARFTSVRVVCANTLAISGARDGATQLKVSRRIEWQPDSIKQRLGVAPQTFADFMANMRRLADHRLRDEQAAAQVVELFGEVAPEAKESRRFNRVMDLFRGLATGADLSGTTGTAWGLLNACTEAIDHGGRAQSDSHRLANAVMGAGERLKTRFRDQLLELVR